MMALYTINPMEDFIDREDEEAAAANSVNNASEGIEAAEKVENQANPSPTTSDPPLSDDNISYDTATAVSSMLDMLMNEAKVSRPKSYPTDSQQQSSVQENQNGTLSPNVQSSSPVVLDKLESKATSSNSTASKTSSSPSTPQVNLADIDKHRVVRRCSLKVSEARGIPKGYVATYVEVFSENRSVSLTTLKEGTSTPFWGEELELNIKPHENILTMRLFGLESKKSRKELLKAGNSTVYQPRDSKTNVKQSNPSVPKGYSAPKLLGEVILDFTALDENAHKETWYTLTIGKSKTKDRKPVEGLDMRASLKFEETLVLPPQKYDSLVKLIMEDSTFELLLLLGRVEEISPKHRVEIAEHIVHMAEAKNETSRLLSILVADEISRTASKQVLFRGNSVVTKALDYYQKLISFDWLSKLQICIDKIFMDEDVTCEIVQSKLNEDDDVEKNVQNLTNYVDFAFSYINTFKEICPSSLRLIYKTLFESAQKKFVGDDDVKYTSVSGFLFLRYFVPAMMTPKLFGLSEAYAEGNSSRSFTLIATVMQKLGNLIEFETREMHLDRMNPWIKRQVPAFKALIEYVCADSKTAPSPKPLEDVDLIAHLASLCRLLKLYRSVFESPKEPSTKAKELLEALDALQPEYAHSKEIIEAVKKRAYEEEKAAEKATEEARAAATPKRLGGSSDGEEQTERSKPTLDKDFLFGSKKSSGGNPIKANKSALATKISKVYNQSHRKPREETEDRPPREVITLRKAPEITYVGPKYKCSQCSWLNPFPNEKCGMCGKERPANPTEADEADEILEVEERPRVPVFDVAEAYLVAKELAVKGAEAERKKLAAAKLQKWKCEKCTVENVPSITFCQMCGNKYTPPAAPTTPSTEAKGSTLQESPHEDSSHSKSNSPGSVNESPNASSTTLPTSSLSVEDRVSSAVPTKIDEPGVSLGSAPVSPNRIPEFSPGAQIGDPPGFSRSRSAPRPRPASPLKSGEYGESTLVSTSAGAALKPLIEPSFKISTTNSSPESSASGIKITTAPVGQRPVSMTNAQIQVKAQQMLAQGVDKALVSAFISQQKALQEASAQVPSSPLTISGELSPSPFPIGAPMPFATTSSHANIIAMTSEQIQEKAKQMLADGIDKFVVVNFIKAQQAIQLQAEAQQRAQTPIFRIQHTGLYKQKTPTGLLICYDCRYDIGKEENALVVANRYYHNTCFHCAKCKKDISELDFFPVTDVMYCISCYADYSSRY